MENLSFLGKVWAYFRAIFLAVFFLVGFNLILGALLISNADTSTNPNLAQFGQFIIESGIGPWNYLFSVLFAVTSIHMVYVLYNKFIARREMTAFNTEDVSSDIIIGLVLGFVLFTLVYLLAVLTGIATVTGTNGIEVLIIPLAIGIQAGYSEELVFRNILYRRIWKIHGHIAALVLTSIPFGILHLINPGSTLLGAINIIITAGIIFGASYALTKRIWLPIFLHLSWNFVQGGIYGIRISGISVNGLIDTQLSGPVLLTGGEFGLEASLFTTIILIPVSIYSLYILFHPEKLPGFSIFRTNDDSILN